MKFTRCLWVFCTMWASTGCMYRFANSSLRPPVGIKTLAVEAIFDSNKQVLPHEMLWEAIQREFAADGRYILTSKSHADAYLRVHLKDAQVQQLEVEGEIETEKEAFFNFANNTYHNPFLWSDKHRASRTAKRQGLSFVAEIELWNTRSQQKMFTKAYPVSGSFKIQDGISPEDTLFIRSEEGYRVLFAQLSRGLAKSVVMDCLRL